MPDYYNDRNQATTVYSEYDSIGSYSSYHGIQLARSIDRHIAIHRPLIIVESLTNSILWLNSSVYPLQVLTHRGWHGGYTFQVNVFITIPSSAVQPLLVILGIPTFWKRYMIAENVELSFVSEISYVIEILKRKPHTTSGD